MGGAGAGQGAPVPTRHTQQLGPWVLACGGVWAARRVCGVTSMLSLRSALSTARSTPGLTSSMSMACAQGRQRAWVQAEWRTMHVATGRHAGSASAVQRRGPLRAGWLPGCHPQLIHPHLLHEMHHSLRAAGHGPGPLRRCRQPRAPQQCRRCRAQHFGIGGPASGPPCDTRSRRSGFLAGHVTLRAPLDAVACLIAESLKTQGQGKASACSLAARFTRP